MHANVLLVDDDQNLIEALRRSLRDQPYRLLAAASGAEALALMQDHEVDVVVSDEKMPGMQGSQLLAEIRRRHPETVCMILTGQASLEAAIRAINEGQIYRFFKKPCKLEELKAGIRQAIQYKELLHQARRLLRVVQEQAAILQAMEREHPGITRLERDKDGAILIEEPPDNVEEVLRSIQEELEARQDPRDRAT